MTKEGKFLMALDRYDINMQRIWLERQKELDRVMKEYPTGDKQDMQLIILDVNAWFLEKENEEKNRFMNDLKKMMEE